MTLSPVFAKSVPYIAAFLGAFLLTLVLTPLVREMNRAFGMVDRPDARRINKIPIPRGGGLALIFGVLASYAAFTFATGRPALDAPGIPESAFWKISALAAGIGALGYADDKFSLRPAVKLLGQILFAALAWGWADLGFHRLAPWLPWWLDLPATVFWIVGAVNAFNLIDGLDGLASGIALIATLGMAGALFLIDSPQATLFHFAFAGGLVGFLRWNFNPASVFLGDCGSMYIGFTVAALPLAHQTADSLLVSVVVPFLAMGVPIFDTFLAIVRRLIRHLISRRGAGEAGNGKVMTADADHIHHRILRAVGLNQRKAAGLLYAASLAAVVVALCATALKSRAAGLWLAAFSAALVVAFRDMAKVELFDAGRLLNSVARDRRGAARRRWARLAVPAQIVFDVAALSAVFFVCAWAFRVRLGAATLRIALPLRVAAVFAAMAFFRVYSTVWARAMVSNYVRLAVACALGTAAGSAAIYYSPANGQMLKAMTVAYAPLAFFAISTMRAMRNVVRDLFYAIDCSRMKGQQGVSRILVYGSGIRYRAFRRELVRTTSANGRMIVGLIDDDILLRDRFIGGIKVYGALVHAPAVIAALKADAVVVACDVSDEWMEIVKKTLAPTGVKITRFRLSEEAVR